MFNLLLEIIKHSEKMSPPTEAYTDVVELCALLQCLGFSVKSLSSSDCSTSQDGGARTVTINCQASGLNVVLESGSSLCSCPPEVSHQNSGVWEVSGVTGGKQLDKEFGFSILGSLPKAHRERLSTELCNIMRCIRENNESDAERSKEKSNKSSSMIEIKLSPERRHSLLKADTPTRYRSLDTLTATKDADQPLPMPGLLQKKPVSTDTSAEDVRDKKMMCQRESTYTLPSPSRRRNNKTSSPIQPKSRLLENLLTAEKTAEELRHKLSSIIKQYTEEGQDDSSMSSLVLDVSKISVLKAEPAKAQFASSPNLSSGLGTAYEDMKKIKLKRIESASASNLVMRQQTSNKEGGMASKLRRISPNFFKSKRDSLTGKDKLKPQDNKNSKLNSMFKPRPVTPKFKLESSPNLSASKKRFSHIKSTIPRPTPKKD